MTIIECKQYGNANKSQLTPSLSNPITSSTELPSECLRIHYTTLYLAPPGMYN